MIQIKRVGHVGLKVPDVDRVAAFYENIVGLEISDRSDGSVFLRCNDEHHCLGLYPAAERGLHHLGLEAHDSEALQRVRTSLGQQGLEVVPDEDPHPGIGESVCYRDPDGNRLKFYEGMNHIDQPFLPREVRPVKFGHITFHTIDLKRTLAFYIGVLGFRLSDTVEEEMLAKVHCNQDHHGVAFLNDGQAKVSHYCFDLADWHAIKEICGSGLRTNGVWPRCDIAVAEL